MKHTLTHAFPAFAKPARVLAALCSLFIIHYSFFISRAAAQAQPDPLATLRKGHPRLVFTEQDWADFDTRVRNRAADPLFDSLLSELEKNARGLLSKPPVERKLIGKRLLATSVEVVQRVLTLAVVHRATGDDAFFHRAEKEMLAAAAFRDWSPGHFLDTAEMTVALALGYDWFYEKLSDKTRAVLRRAIVEKGLREGMDPSMRFNWWHRAENNWSQNCFGGLSLGALAVAEDEPKIARAILNLARAGIVNGLKSYAPDGVYPEGPGYWSYGSTSQVLLNAALETALGTDWGLNASPGFLASANAQLHLRGPTGEMYNFSDCLRVSFFTPVMFWFAKKTGNPALAIPPEPSARGGRWLAKNVNAVRTSPLVALWWPRDGLASGTPAPALPLAWKGEGKNPVAVFRSSWTDPGAMWLACKAGVASASHGHMDAGSFVLEADGVRWAVDLGRQGYESLDSKGIKTGDAGQHGQRWSVFRLNNFSHNTLTIGGQLHRVNGRADFVKFWDGNDANASGAMMDGELTAGAAMDLSPVFEGQAKNVRRVFTFFQKSRKVWIADVIEGVKPGAEVRWAMVTRAQVRISADGDYAELSQDGKTLIAETITIPEEGQRRFEVIPAAPAVENDYDNENPDTRILVVRATAPKSGNMRIMVELRTKTAEAK